MGARFSPMPLPHQSVHEEPVFVNEGQQIIMAHGDEGGAEARLASPEVHDAASAGGRSSASGSAGARRVRSGKKPAPQSQSSLDLWKRINPGYVESGPAKSTTQDEFSLPEGPDLYRKEHHKKRDRFTDHAEAWARQQLLLKSSRQVGQ